MSPIRSSGLVFCSLIFCLCMQNSFARNLHQQKQGAHYDPGLGRTLVLIGQNYLDEYQQYSQDSGSLPAGASTYGDIYSGQLNKDSQNLIEALAHDNQHNAYVEIGFSWKDGLASHGYADHRTITIEEDIVAGKFDANIDSIAAYMQTYPQLRFLFRIDYEVSGNFHCNTNPIDWDQNTQNCAYYKAAFNYIAHRIRDLNHTENVDFVYHPVRGQADALYPGSEFVDWVGFSVFNHDLCLNTIETDGPFYNCPDQSVDPNLAHDIDIVKQNYKKPVIISESAYQQSTQTFQLYLSRLFSLIENNDIHALVYIHSNWPNHSWQLPWRDSRLTNDPAILTQWLDEIILPRYITQGSN